jgi:hypothetical protein
MTNSYRESASAARGHVGGVLGLSYWEQFEISPCRSMKKQGSKNLKTMKLLKCQIKN